MQGLKRRIIHGLSFELIALVLAIPIAAWVFNDGLLHIGIMTAVISVLAMGWNIVFNRLFEGWEARQTDQRRTMQRRILHALGFEFGLLVVTLPLIAWWMKIPLWEALLTDLGFLLFFLVYGFIFNWGFDRVFGLPDLPT
jgi:uncharacterized membrane protein